MPDVWNAVRDIQLSASFEDPDPFATWEIEKIRPHWVYDDPKILVVDDDIDTRHLITLMLEHDGLTSLEAADGEVAMTLAMAESPDLVILDVMMPGLDGYTVCRQLREDPLPARRPRDHADRLVRAERRARVHRQRGRRLPGQAGVPAGAHGEGPRAALISRVCGSGPPPAG
jgi:CheY-like chemotaxis protein